MTAILRHGTGFLRQTVGAGPRLLLVGAAVLVAAVHFVPLWNLTMFAPQYADGLRLDIYAHTMVGGNNGQDIREINVLNHYIGMRDLAVEDFTEFKWMPFVLGALALLYLRAVVFGTVEAMVDATVVFCYFGAFSLWSFGHMMYEYGHNLAPDAAVRVDPFTPPLFGYRQIANFEVYSYPQAGTYLLGGVFILLVAALWMAWRQYRAGDTGAAHGVQPEFAST